MGKLEGKHTLITGGGDSGIGAEVARLFAAEGADVAIIYNADDAGARQVAADVQRHGRQALTLKGDTGEPQ